MTSSTTGIEHLLTPTADALPPAPQAISAARLRQLALVFFDCDGVLTDGRVWVDAQGQETKAFSVIDGHGLAILRESGVQIGMITRAPQGITTARAQKLRFDIIRTGITDKATAVREILAERHLTPDQVAFVGDDLHDLGAFAEVGLRIAPATARPQVIARADAVTKAPGGAGAAREICDAIVTARLRASTP